MKVTNSLKLWEKIICIDPSRLFSAVDNLDVIAKCKETTVNIDDVTGIVKYWFFWRMYAEYWWLTKSEQWNVNKVHMVKYIYVVNIMEFEWKHVNSWVLNLLGVGDSSCCQLWFVPHVMCTCSALYTLSGTYFLG